MTTELKPGTINGYPVRAVFEFPATPGCRPGRVILVERDPEFIDCWIVAHHYETDDHWAQGEYFASFASAWPVFVMDAARHFPDIERSARARAAG